MNIESVASLALPVIFTALTVFAVGIAIAIAIREQKSTITGEREKDLIDIFADDKKKQLYAIPGAISFKVYAVIMVIAPIVLGIAAFVLTQSALAAVIGLAVGVVAPELIVRIQKSKSDKDFDEKYGRALKQMSSTLRAGMTIQQSVDDICTNPFLDNEIKEMFKQISADIKIGIPVAEAFAKVSNMRSTIDTRDVTAAVAMQSEVGGSEAEVIELVATNINERIMVRKEIRTLFTTAKITVYAMDFVPPILLIGLILTGGDLMDFYKEGITGLLVMGAIMLLFLIGSVVSHKMMKSADVRSE
ncbi:MAG: type II secretion system F family protein [Ruminiclostridium sp.]|nr:type II secretion system F family protein [Ruminiclostridium sp.]MBP3856940.1 type II secretion system F family protein [Ruminiclostridium sp.]